MRASESERLNAPSSRLPGTSQAPAFSRLALACLIIGVGFAQAGCAGARAAQAPKPVLVSDQTLRQCLARLERTDAAKAGKRKAFAQLTADLKADPEVVEKMNFQPEFISSIQKYMRNVVSDKRVTDGRAMMRRHSTLLTELQRRYGVPREVLLAVWGIETNYGQNFGKRPLLRSLATLACHGRRQAFFRGELIAAVKILDAGHVDPDTLVGSWAGAFGHTQFMPSTFLRRAVDHNGDGKRDLMGNLGDALASTATYLRKSGWQTELPWGFEVSAPASVTAHYDTRKVREPVSRWLRKGVKALNAQEANELKQMPANTQAALIRPAESGGPTFLVFSNFDAIHAYNPSMKYSLAVAHLSDRIAGGGAFKTAWPAIEKPLSRTERKELQSLLTARGHRIGRIDGILGARSRAAMRQERKRLGSRISQSGPRALLNALRET